MTEIIIEISQQDVVIEVGVQGPPGPPGGGTATISKDPDNLIEVRANGIFVPASQDLGTFN